MKDYFWFFRGVAAAFSVISFLPLIVDLSNFEILRAFRALTYSWHQFVTWVDESVGQYFRWWPDTYVGTLNYAAIGLAVSLPVTWALFRPFFMNEPEAPKSRNRFELSSFVLALITPVIRTFPPIVLLVLIWVSLSPIVLLDYIYFRNYDGLFWFALSIFVVVFSIALLELKGYAKGLWAVLSFFASMQILYEVNAPGVASWINERASAATGDWRD
jgi:hypothetical protein